MQNELILSPQAEMLPSSAPIRTLRDEAILAHLQQSVRLPIICALPGEKPEITVGFGAGPDATRDGYAFVQSTCAPAEVADLMDALAALAEITGRFGDRDLASIVKGSHSIAVMLAEFPKDIALDAINEWPKTPVSKLHPYGGRMFPEAADLYQSCEKRFAFRKQLRDMLKDAAENAQTVPDESDSNQRSLEPYGRTLAFHNEVEGKYGRPYAFSWLNKRNCEFTNDTVFTTGFGRERLMGQCSGIAAKHRIKIVECRQVTNRFHDSFARRS